jgi:hypothetical protein
MNLYKETVELLSRQTTHTNVRLAKEANVSLRWLGYLINEGKEDYSVSKVQRVYDILSAAEKKA